MSQISCVSLQAVSHCLWEVMKGCRDREGHPLVHLEKRFWRLVLQGDSKGPLRWVGCLEYETEAAAGQILRVDLQRRSFSLSTLWVPTGVAKRRCFQ